MLKTKVKASSVTNLTDARYFAAWETEWLGFNLNTGSEHYIQPNNMKAIKEWVDGVKVVGEFDLQDAEDILAAADLLELDAVQVGTFATQDTLQALHDQEVPIIKEVVVQSLSELDAIAARMQAEEAWVDYFLLDFEKNGISWPEVESESLATLKHLAEAYPLLITIELDAQQLNKLLEAVPIRGISVRGGAEEKVGYKSFDELDELFEELEVLI
jgi:phosphoribosylanthranilate isomerase